MCKINHGFLTYPIVLIGLSKMVFQRKNGMNLFLISAPWNQKLSLFSSFRYVNLPVGHFRTHKNFLAQQGSPGGQPIRFVYRQFMGFNQRKHGRKKLLVQFLQFLAIRSYLKF